MAYTKKKNDEQNDFASFYFPKLLLQSITEVFFCVHEKKRKKSTFGPDNCCTTVKIETK